MAEEIRESATEKPEVHPRLGELFARIERLPPPLQLHVVGLLDSLLRVHEVIERLSRPEDRPG